LLGYKKFFVIQYILGKNNYILQPKKNRSLYVGSVLTWSARPRPTTLLPPRSNGKTRGC